jgi:multisubunit Na+/H+ antiporter MnhF subunit
MAGEIHPAAPHHIPAFIVEPGQSDTLMIVTGIILMAAVIGVGVLFFRLHTLPERIAHRTHKLQFEIVAVLGLLALFTHQHIFWVIGLILALIQIPDFLSPLKRIAGASEKMAGIEPEYYADPHEPAGEPEPTRSEGK